MVNVSGESFGNGPGFLQIVKKVVVTKDQYKDHANEIGFTPYRLHTNEDGTFVTHIRVYDERVYVLDDEAPMKVGEWFIEADKLSSKLVYFVEGDGSGVALQGVRRPCGV